jgi:glycosyltransferase involved in cell wall biosynthesis
LQTAEKRLEFPDRQSSWRRPAIRAALLGARDAQVVLATGGPWTALVAAEEIARRLRIPLVSDFRDPWTRNPNQVGDSRSRRLRSRALERQIVNRSSFVIANTEELRQQFVADYPQLVDRFMTITNGFDQVPSSPPLGSGRFDLCHFGTVYGGRAPINLLRAVDALASEGRLDPADFRLRFVGRWEVESRECNALTDRLIARGLVMREAPIPHEACLVEMQRAGALLVLQSGFPLQIPAKIYEYLATGRPIAFIGDEGATASLIRRHGLGAASADEPSATRHLLETLTSSGEQAAARPDRSQFHYRALTATLAACLDEAIGADPRRMRTAS